MANDDKIYKVDWTMHDCELTYSTKYNDWSDLDQTLKYTSPAIEINGVPDLFAEFDDELLRDKYPELMAAWEQYQNLLDKYRMWDNVTNPPESD